MYVPLSHPPGHAQCDFGQAKAVIGGVEQTVHYFVLDLPHSDACFVKAYPAETTEAFCDDHVSAFSFLGGVPRSILYDNTRLAVARSWRPAERTLLLGARVALPVRGPFCRPGKGNELGYVAGTTSARSRASMPSTPSRSGAWTTRTIGQRMERDLEALLAFPAVPYDERQAREPCQLPALVGTGPTTLCPWPRPHLTALCGRGGDQLGAEVAPRSSRDDFVFDPIHYLPLLERMTGALDQAAPLAGWELPEEFGVHRMGFAGAAADGELPQGGPRSARQLRRHLCAGWRADLRLDLELPLLTVTKTSASDYMALMSGIGLERSTVCWSTTSRS